jgi:hypothetical protein
MSLIAQEKFIEVTVSDTVLAPADILIYTVSTTDYEFDGPLMRDTIANGGIASWRSLKENRYHFDSVISVIRSKGYTLLPLSAPDSFDIEERVGQRLRSRRVLTSSVGELSRLYQTIQKMSGINASVDMLISDDFTYQKTLFKKLISDATGRAATVATLSDRKLGKILSVVENRKEASVGGWTIYPPLSAMGDAAIPGWHANFGAEAPLLNTNLPINNFVPIANTLTVRFAIE